MAERKTQRVRIDAIRNSIKKGEYDNELADLFVAIDLRRQVLREALLEKVKEVYGEDYVVTKPSPGLYGARSAGFVSAPGPNPPEDSPVPEPLAEPEDAPTDGEYESRTPLIGPTNV